MSGNIRKLVILHTNDVHSAFAQMPKISSVMTNLRQRHHDSGMLVLDIGDHMERTVPETEGTDGLINVEVMNATGYELQVPATGKG